MNTSLLVRVNKDIKEQFEAQAKNQGVSMTFLLKTFMETYIENPQIVRSCIDEELLDEVWNSKKVQDSVRQLSSTLQAK
jgi:antitoxin component of RelBE/YafQ-DinJ toxin-antitoxin module